MDENLYPRSTEYYQPNEEEDKRVEEAKQAEINAIKQDMTVGTSALPSTSLLTLYQKK